MYITSKWCTIKYYTSDAVITNASVYLSLRTTVNELTMCLIYTFERQSSFSASILVSRQTEGLWNYRKNTFGGGNKGKHECQYHECQCQYQAALLTTLGWHYHLTDSE